LLRLIIHFIFKMVKRELKCGETLKQGESLSSESGFYSAIMETSGNFAVYVGRSLRTTWKSDTDGRGAYVAMELGDLRIYDSFDAVIWSAGVNEGNSLVVQNNGQLAILSVEGKTIWTSPLTD
jgi:hypothetical protein